MLEKLTEILREYEGKVQSLPPSLVIGTNMVEQIDLTDIKIPVGYYDGKPIKNIEDLNKILKK